jgi:hypothetical protein
MRLVILIGILSIAFFRTSTALCRPQPNPGDEAKAQDAISFDVFASFKRIRKGNPVFACKPPEWAAAAHAIVTGDTIHYLWARRKVNNYWMMMHSTARIPFPVLESCRPQVLCLLSRQAKARS